MMWGGGGDGDDDLAGGGGDFRLLVLGRRRPVARRKRNEVAVGRLAGDRGFTLVASCDVNLHHKVFNFTSPGGRGPIFLHMDRLLEQRFLPQTVQKLVIFTFGPSIGDALNSQGIPHV